MPALRSFIGPAYNSVNPLTDPEDLWNWFIEPVDGPGKSVEYSYVPTPGVETVITVPESPIRALVQVPAASTDSERGFLVAGARVYEIEPDLSVTSRGTLSGVGPDPATISYNGEGGGQLLMTSAGVAASYDLTANTLTAISGLAAHQGGMLNGYGLALDQATSTLRLSDLLDLTTWDPTQFAQRSIAPDPWRAMIVLYPRIYLFGEHTTEVWYDAGSFPFPFAPVQGVLIQEGVEAPFSLAVVGSQVYWLSRSGDGTGRVLRTAGYRPEVVSTRAVETAIQGYHAAGRINDAVAWSYQQDGHEFYLLTFPAAGVTWVYDTGLPPEIGWHKRGTWISEEARFEAGAAQFHAFLFGKHLVGDRTAGRVYHLRSDVATDVPNASGTARWIRRVRRTPLLTQEQQWIFFTNLQVWLQTGIGLGTGQGSDPQLMLRWSDDAGRTWSAEHWVSAGAQGAYTVRAIWWRLGRSRNRVFELSVSDPVPWRLAAAYFKATVGAA